MSLFEYCRVLLSVLFLFCMYVYAICWRVYGREWGIKKTTAHRHLLLDKKNKGLISGALEDCDTPPLFILYVCIHTVMEWYHNQNIITIKHKIYSRYSRCRVKERATKNRKIFNGIKSVRRLCYGPVMANWCATGH